MTISRRLPPASVANGTLSCHDAQRKGAPGTSFSNSTSLSPPQDRLESTGRRSMKTAENRQPVHIGKVVRNARVFNFRNPRGGNLSDSGLLGSVARLFALLEERRIDYLLVGGIALLQYVEGRNTEDIDLIMSLSSLERRPELRMVGREDDFARADFAGLQID